MNISEIHDGLQPVSAKPFFKGEVGVTVSIQLQENSELKEHITKTPAMLICIRGEAIYEDEQDKQIRLTQGNYVLIEPNVKHRLLAKQLSDLILLK